MVEREGAWVPGAGAGAVSWWRQGAGAGAVMAGAGCRVPAPVLVL